MPCGRRRYYILLCAYSSGLLVQRMELYEQTCRTGSSSCSFPRRRSIQLECQMVTQFLIIVS
jgi:hypothetical protein